MFVVPKEPDPPEVERPFRASTAASTPLASTALSLFSFLTSTAAAYCSSETSLRSSFALAKRALSRALASISAMAASSALVFFLAPLGLPRLDISSSSSFARRRASAREAAAASEVASACSRRCCALDFWPSPAAAQ